LFCSFINTIPYTFAGFVDITISGGCCAATGSVSHPFGTFHRADECCLLQQTVATHPASEQWPFYKKFCLREKPSAKFFFFKRIKCRLPPAGGFYRGHYFLINILIELTELHTPLKIFNKSHSICVSSKYQIGCADSSCYFLRVCNRTGKSVQY